MPPPSQQPDDLGPPKADFSAPPPYELTDSLQQQQLQMPVQPQPTSKLPTYEEVQMEKILNDEMQMPPHQLQPPPPPNINGGRNMQPGAIQTGTNNHLTFIAIDTDGETVVDQSLLGTDIMFITAFLIAFLFNWIGFLMLTCFCHTIAARYGALSGFGLSLAKWTLIVKHSTDIANTTGNSWLWWLIMAFGFLICIRALLQYISIKRTWRLLSTSAQERLLFFY